MTRANNQKESEKKGWHDVAWAFLKPFPKGSGPDDDNTRRRLRLQLFKPSPRPKDPEDETRLGWIFISVHIPPIPDKILLQDDMGLVEGQSKKISQLAVRHRPGHESAEGGQRQGTEWGRRGDGRFVLGCSGRLQGEPGRCQDAQDSRVVAAAGTKL